MGYRKIINRQDYSPKRVIGKSKHRLLLQPKTRPKKKWQRFVLSDTEFREERVLKPLHPPDRLEPATLSVAQKRSGRTTTLLWAERSRYSGCQQVRVDCVLFPRKCILYNMKIHLISLVCWSEVHIFPFSNLFIYFSNVFWWFSQLEPPIGNLFRYQIQAVFSTI